jgi:hypothetical protein
MKKIMVRHKTTEKFEVEAMLVCTFGPLAVLYTIDKDGKKSYPNVTHLETGGIVREFRSQAKAIAAAKDWKDFPEWNEFTYTRYQSKARQDKDFVGQLGRKLKATPHWYRNF